MSHMRGSLILTVNLIINGKSNFFQISLSQLLIRQQLRQESLLQELS